MKPKFIIPAILLISPVMLILLFDPAAWLSKTNLVSDIFGTILFVDVPIGMCLWHWFKPEHFRKWRWMIPFGLMTLGCWAVFAGSMWIDCRIGHGPRNGFAAVCAYAFGWGLHLADHDPHRRSLCDFSHRSETDPGMQDTATGCRP